MSGPAKIELSGLAIDAYTAETLIDRLMSDADRNVGGYLMTPNLDNLRGVSVDHDLMARAQMADIRVADGMPLLWASRIQRTPLPARVAGSDLIFLVSEACAPRSKSVYLLGGAPETAEIAAEALRARFSRLIVSGTYCPPPGFERDPQEIKHIRAILTEADPDFVFIGLPFPKASTVVATLRSSLPATWFLGLGISFSFVCGDVVRAPRWMQRTGLEWLFRLRQEPARLARRYLIEGPPFLLRLLATSLVRRYSGGGSPRTNDV